MLSRRSAFISQAIADHLDVEREEEGHDMGQRKTAKPVRLMVRTTLTAAALLAVFDTPPVSAQKKNAPKPAAPAAQTTQQPQQQPNLIYSPWTKFCLKGQERNAKQVCFTAKDARQEGGTPMFAAVLIEPEKDPKKVLRVTLPLGMQIAHGTRVVIDKDKPALGPYVICFASGCLAEYDATPDVIERLKKGKQLAIQAVNSNGQAISLNLPLDDFAKTYGGPPTDLSSLEERQKKLQQELQQAETDFARQKSENTTRARERAKPR